MRPLSAFLRVLAASLSVTLVAVVAAAPPSITDLASKIDLTSQDRQAISAYATHYGQMIANADSDPGAVREAKRKLEEPLRAPRIREVFLDSYSRELGDVLESAVKGESPHAASNALIIFSKLGTESALNRLTNYVDIRDEERDYIRIVAARSVRDLLQSRFFSENLRPIPGASRRLRDAASREPSPLALRRQLEGIIAGDRQALDPGTRRQIYENLATAIQSAADRAANAGIDPAESAELMDAAHAVLGRVRQALMTIVDPGLQTFVVEQLVKPTLQLLNASLVHWDPLHEDNGLEAEVTEMVKQGELTLQTIALFSPGSQRPKVDLPQSWSSGDRAQYEQGLEVWRQAFPGR